MTPLYSLILWWPKRNIHKIFIPQKILIFLKTPKNIETQKFEPKKWPEPTYVWKYQSDPLGELVALLSLYSCCRVAVRPLYLFLSVPWLSLLWSMVSFTGHTQLLFKQTHIPAWTDTVWTKTNKLNIYTIRFTKQVTQKVNPYKHSVLFMGHGQRVQTPQTRRRRTRCLIMAFLQFLLAEMNEN